MHDEQTPTPIEKNDDAGIAKNEAGHTPKNLGMFPSAPSKPLSVALPATPKTDVLANDKSTGEGGRAVVEPPKPGEALPAMPKGDDEELQYSLTLKEVPDILRQAGRKVPSLRTLTRYCNERGNHLICRKVKTSYGQEWLINKESLAVYIDHQPIEVEPDEVALATKAIGNAGEATTETPDEKTAIPGVSSSAVTVAKAEAPIGEKRTVAEVLIENERLLATNEGLKSLVAEVKEDKEFLREEVREARQYKGDMKQLTQDVLDTLTAVATGGRLLRERGDDGDKDKNGGKDV